MLPNNYKWKNDIYDRHASHKSDNYNKVLSITKNLHIL